MAVRMLDPIFKPRRIALVGVTPNPKSVGGKILANLVGGGFPGVVYPVNAAHEAVMGIPCFPRIKGLPRTPDLAILCAAASQVPDLLRECGESGIKGAIIASAGFREAGPAGRALEDRLRAIRPYPEEYVRKIRIGSTKIVLRPIKPEDEPLWTELLAGCSRETIYYRFRHFFIWQSHDVAARYCTTDYERELAIVAETVEDGRRRLLGIGRLIADPERRTAEYAILISDSWQNRGLGNSITSHVLGLAGEWGVCKLTAVTTTDNPRMIAVFKKLGFDIVPDETGASVRAAKDLDK